MAADKTSPPIGVSLPGSWILDPDLPGKASEFGTIVLNWSWSHNSKWSLFSWLGGGFKYVFIFTPTWGRFPFWLIFFRWVETTIQIIVKLRCHTYNHGQMTLGVIYLAISDKALKKTRFDESMGADVNIAKKLEIFRVGRLTRLDSLHSVLQPTVIFCGKSRPPRVLQKVCSA